MILLPTIKEKVKRKSRKIPHFIDQRRISHKEAYTGIKNIIELFNLLLSEKILSINKIKFVVSEVEWNTLYINYNIPESQIIFLSFYYIESYLEQLQKECEINEFYEAAHNLSLFKKIWMVWGTPHENMYDNQ